MTKEQLIEALKMLGRGRIDAAEAIAEHLMPTPKTIAVDVPEPKAKIGSFAGIKDNSGRPIGAAETFEAPFPMPSAPKKGK